MSTQTIGDLLKPRLSTVQRTYDFCSNCGLFMHGSHDELCRTCERIEDPEMQIWECARCETVRIYGMAVCVDPSSKRLHCHGCGQITEHRFSHVNGRV